jgi:glycosyltransferase involved in cell wall biosynthesis
LFTGQLEIRKGILFLLETFRRHSNEIDAKLIITGRGGLEVQIKRFIEKNNLQDKVLFLGWVDRELLWSLYKDALAVIVPSIVPDPGPMVIVEALSVGTPVIGSEQAGYVRDVTSKVFSHLYFNGKKIESLASLLKNFRKEDYPPKKVKKICQRWFSVANYISRYLEILETMTVC